MFGHELRVLEVRMLFGWVGVLVSKPLHDLSDVVDLISRVVAFLLLDAQPEKLS